MILAALGPVTAYRMHTPRWATAPTSGAKGSLFASTLAAEGTNLVVFKGRLEAADLLQVYDPAGALPKSQDSWR
jgi:RES domain-containing protein